MVVRAGFGIYWESQKANDYEGLYLNAPFVYPANLTAGSTPTLFVDNLFPPIDPNGPIPLSVEIQTRFMHEKPPYSPEWNFTIQQRFASNWMAQVTYEGSSLIRGGSFNQANPGAIDPTGLIPLQQRRPIPNFATISMAFDGGFANYNALQVQYRKPFSSRIQALVNYSYAHSLDSSSNDTIAGVSNSVISSANDYSSSSFDARHIFSGAVTFAIPGAGSKGALFQATKDWSLEGMVVARIGFPFNGSVLTATIGGANPRPDRVPNEALWIANPNAGGGKSLNPLAFTPAPAGEQGTEGRNDIPGFGLTQVDLSLGRKFAITERIAVQLRTDAFNLFNHPNFSNPRAFIGSGASFLSSSSMANQGLGGLNSVFQQGGPRSLQLSLKLSF